MLEEGHKLNGDYVSNNEYEQSVSGASVHSEYLEETYSISYAKDCSENTLLSDSRNILTTYQRLSTEVPPNSKSISTLPSQLKGSVPLTVYHQNIRGLREKVNELLSQLYPTFPHILCLSEHHMKHLELQKSHLDNYKLGSSYCRTMYEMGGICIYVQESLNYVRLDLEKYCQDKNFEVCAIKTHLDMKSVCIIAIYRAPSGNFDLFLSKLDVVLRNLYTATLEYIICGDINVDYLTDNDKKSRLEALLKTYNLTSVVNFPTRIQKNSASAIDNIFIDTSKTVNYSVCPMMDYQTVMPNL
jgi:exonuclease III